MGTFNHFSGQGGNNHTDHIVLTKHLPKSSGESWWIAKPREGFTSLAQEKCRPAEASLTGKDVAKRPKLSRGLCFVLGETTLLTSRFLLDA